MRYIFLLLVSLASITVFITVVKPRYTQLKTVRKDVMASGVNLSTANKLAASREALIAKYNTLSKADLDNLKTLLPDSVGNIRLIIQINALANKNGLSVLRNVDYKSDTVDSKTATATTTPDVSKKPYGEFTISFQTSGQYNNFLSFVSDLEQNLRIVDVVSVEFATNESAQQGAVGLMNYKVTLKTYWLKQ